MEFKKLKVQIAAGVILIFIGITFLLHNYIVDKRDEVFSSMNIAISEEIKKDEEEAKKNSGTTNTGENNNEGENLDERQKNENDET